MMNTNSRLNSLFTRMLSNESASTSASANQDNHNQENNDSGISSLSTKRNLFGIRLNHDQLKQDLKEMWKEQIEIQKNKWNFDFEKLKPISSNEQTNSSVEAEKRFEWCRVNTYYQPGLSADDSAVSNASNDSLTMTKTAFDKDDYDMSHDPIDHDNEDEEEEEDDDLALAVPQFYKYQRRMKLSQNNQTNRLKYMKMVNFALNQQQQSRCVDSSTPIKRFLSSSNKKPTKKTANTQSLLFDSISSFKPIFQIKTTKLNNENIENPSTSSASATTTTKTTRSRKTQASKSNQDQEICKPKAVKLSTIQQPQQDDNTDKKIKKKKNPTNKKTNSKRKLSPSAQNLIITFSENRKDTLRSARDCTNTNQIEIDLNSTVATTNSINNKLSSSSTSAFQTVQTTNQKSQAKDNMKQQTLLDLFKQRKRRNSSSNLCNSDNNTLKATLASAAACATTTHFLRSHSNATALNC